MSLVHLHVVRQASLIAFVEHQTADVADSGHSSDTPQHVRVKRVCLREYRTTPATDVRLNLLGLHRDEMPHCVPVQAHFVLVILVGFHGDEMSHCVSAHAHFVLVILVGFDVLDQLVFALEQDAAFTTNEGLHVGQVVHIGQFVHVG